MPAANTGISPTFQNCRRDHPWTSPLHLVPLAPGGPQEGLKNEGVGSDFRGQHNEAC